MFFIDSFELFDFAWNANVLMFLAEQRLANRTRILSPRVLIARHIPPITLTDSIDMHIATVVFVLVSHESQYLPILEI